MAENQSNWNFKPIEDNFRAMADAIVGIIDKLTDKLAGISKEAKDVEKSLGGMSGATKENQKDMEEAAERAERLAKKKKELKLQELQATRALAEANHIARENAQVQKLQAQVAGSLSKSINALTAQYKLNVIELKGMSKAQRNSKGGKAMQKETKALSKEISGLNKSMGDSSSASNAFTGSITSIPGPVGMVIRSVRGLGAALMILLKNPVVVVIALIVGALVGLYAAFTRTLEGTEAVRAVTNTLVAVMQTTLNVLSEIALAIYRTVIPAFKTFINSAKLIGKDWQALMLEIQIAWDKLFGGSNKVEELQNELSKVTTETNKIKEEQVELNKTLKTGWADAIAGVLGYGDALKDNLKKGKEKTKAENAAHRMQVRNLTENAKLEAEGSMWRAKSEAIRRFDAVKAIEYTEKAYAARLKSLDNTRKEMVLNEKAAKEKAGMDVLNWQAQIDLANATKARMGATTALFNKETETHRMLNRMRTQAAAQAKARTLAQLDIEADGLEEMLSNNQAIVDNTESTIAERQGALERNAIHERTMIEQKGEAEKDFIKKLEEYKVLSDADKILRINAMDAKTGELLSEQRQRQFDEEAKILESHDKHWAEKIRGWETYWEKEYAMEIRRVDIIADIKDLEIDMMQKSDAKKNTLSLEAEKERLVASVVLAEQRRNLVGKEKQKEIDEELVMLDVLIKSINHKIGKAKQDHDLWDMLGIDMDDNRKQGIQSATDFAISQVNAVLDAKIKAAEIAVQLADKEIAAAQKLLDFEMTARANGYASNVEYARKEKQQAENQKKAALKEQEKFQKAQEKIQLVQQSVNLVTASSLIFAQIGNPFIAIPLIAVMWGAFAAAKLEASKVTKPKSESYGDGTVELLQGGSHASGSDVDLGTKADGTRRRAEGGEYFAVINKRSSKKFRNAIPDVINSLNNGSFVDRYANTFSGAEGMNFSVQQPNFINLAQIENDLRDIKEQRSRNSYIDAQGNMVEQYKNLKRTARR